LRQALLGEQSSRDILEKLVDDYPQGSQVSDMYYTEPPTRNPSPDDGVLTRFPKRFIGGTNRQRLLLAGFTLVGLVISAVVGSIAAQSDMAKPRLDVVMYAGEDSFAEFFYSDEYGLLTQERSLSAPVIMGVNNVSFGLGDQSVQESFFQRFDPCACNSPILFESISLVTPLYSERVPVSSWFIGGDVQSLKLEGSSVLLVTAPAGFDPQIFLELDIRGFSERAKIVVFWVSFTATFALILFFWAFIVV
jgi:hypothetical protein